MRYSTDFSGCFKFSRPLTLAEDAYLHDFSYSRRMKRDIKKLPNDKVNDRSRAAVSLPLGEEGEFVANYDKNGLLEDDCGFGQTHDESIIDYNAPPASQPSLWCHWRPSESKQALEWSGAEKFYNSVLWLEYMIEKFFKPWGIVLNGQVEFQGEAKKDRGCINITENRITGDIPYAHDNFTRKPNVVLRSEKNL